MLYFLCADPFLCTRIKDRLRRKFAELANDFERRLYGISSELAAIDGPLEVQKISGIQNDFIVK